MSMLTERPTYSVATRLKVAERLFIAGLRAQERADESDEARVRLSFLLNASQRLALCLEPATVLQTLLDLAVPELADAATLHILTPGRRAPLVTSAISDSAQGAPLAWWEWIERVTRPAIADATERGMAQRESAAPGAPPAPSVDGPAVSFIVVPMRARGRTLGALRVLSVAPRRAFRLDDLSLLESFTNQASLALENARLFQEQRELVGHLEAVRGQLDTPQTEWLRSDERLRIARDLHDHVEQIYFAIGLTAESALDARDHALVVPELADALRRTAQLATSGAEQLRGAIFALKHADTSAVGLISSLRKLVHSFEERTGVDTDLVLSGPESDPSAEVIEALLAVATEALANVERHAHASSVVMTLQMRPRSMTLVVHDDGMGVSDLILNRRGSSAMHFGLDGLRERVRRLKGHFKAEPGPAGGFVVRAQVPLAKGGKR
ncbi:MAG: GAF domain-containing protein [Chloroflexi bacterium]|nr:GAF domain-containing protein [Chloroflexota bacterium]